MLHKITERLFSPAQRYVNLHPWEKTIKKEQYCKSSRASKSNKRSYIPQKSAPAIPLSYTIQNMIVMRGS